MAKQPARIFLAGDIRAKRGCEASEVCGATVSLGRASVGSASLSCSSGIHRNRACVAPREPIFGTT